MFCSSCGTAQRDGARFCRACGQPLGGPSGPIAPQVLPSAVATASTAPAAADYATFANRALALVVDWLILTGVGVVIGIVLLVGVGIDDPDDVFLRLVSLLLGWLYYAGMESSERQATFGKSFARIRVMTVEGRRVSFGRASGRFFGKLLSAIPFGLGFLLMVFTKRKQTLHDLLSGCVVVGARKPDVL